MNLSRIKFLVAVVSLFCLVTLCSNTSVAPLYDHSVNYEQHLCSQESGSKQATHRSDTELEQSSHHCDDDFQQDDNSNGIITIDDDTMRAEGDQDETIESIEVLTTSGVSVLFKNCDTSFCEVDLTHLPPGEYVGVVHSSKTGYSSQHFTRE